MSSRFLLPTVLAALLVGCGTVRPSAPAPALHDYLVTAAKPDRLFLIDPAERRVVGDYRIPDAHDYVLQIVPSADGKVVYAAVNKAQSIAGIDLDTGREVFRADLSSPGERVNCIAYDITPDGKELVVYEYPTRLGLDEYTVESPRFAIFSTAGGLQARPLRQFEAPRRIQAVLARPGNRSFYAFWPDVYEFDLKTGSLLGKRDILHWHRPNHSPADLSINFPIANSKGIFSSPVYSTLTGPGLPPGGVAESSLMVLDLGTGQLEYHDFGRTTDTILPAALSPDGRWAFGDFGALLKIDTRHWTVAGRVALPHAYYGVNVSSDGKEVYVGGAMCDIGIYDARTLANRGDIRLPGCGDQSLAVPRIIRR